MLLVKSKELKNSDKTKAQFVLGLLLFIPCCAFAQSTSGFSATDILSTFLALLAVVALIFGLAFVMRRFNVTQGGSSDIKNVASMMVGAKERIIVVQVGNEQHLLGVTSNHISHLSKLESNLEIASKDLPGDIFKQKFTQLLNSQQQDKGADQ